MPKQIYDIQTLLELLKNARKIKVVKRKDYSKIKVRVGKYLYTYVGSPDEPDKILSNVKEKDKIVYY
ncbi:MAG: hypothetical protein RXO71_03005 [Nitrososphaeria archaeon]|jgi:uncharacterized Fe-S center protein|nr:hypothetical protein [Nitrososphaerota archaeon]